jgi:hypothetical protein
VLCILRECVLAVRNHKVSTVRHRLGQREARP